MRTLPLGVLAAALATAVMAPAALAQGAPTIQITSPQDGAKITTNDIPVTVAVSNYKLDCQTAGMPDQPGVGHWHLMLDGTEMAQLTNFYCNTSVTVSGEGVQPGPHTLMAVLATNTHTDVGKPVSVKIDFEPAAAMALPAAKPGPTPTIKILSPADGATVTDPAHLAVNMAVTNFTPSLALEGKPNVDGFGHIHLFVLNQPMNMSGGMMSMGGMVLMPGSTSATLDLSMWPAGKYMLVAMLVGDDHNPIKGAMPAEINLALQTGIAGALPKTGGGGGASTGSGIPAAPLAAGGLLAILAGAWVWRRSSAGVRQ